MEKIKKYKNSIWRVPLISVIAGFFYTPIYVRSVIRFGVIEPGVIDSRVSLLISARDLSSGFGVGWNAAASETVKKGNIYFCGSCFCLWNDTASDSITHRSNNGACCGCIYVLGTAVGMDRFFLGAFFLLKRTL